MKESCPNCDSRTGLREILYGMPAEPIDETKYEIGGCVISPFQPTWACIECSWRGWELNNTDGTKLNEIRCPLCESKGKVILLGLDDEENKKARRNTYKFEIQYEEKTSNALCTQCGWTCLLKRTFSY